MRRELVPRTEKKPEREREREREMEAENWMVGMPYFLVVALHLYTEEGRHSSSMAGEAHPWCELSYSQASKICHVA